MKHEALIELARCRFKEAMEADRENRLRAQDDLENLTGEGQWPDDVRKEREDDGRPCLTINRLPQFVRQVTGDIRRMNPAISVIPSDEAASPEVAEIYEGLIRQIEYKSRASRVYEKAAESAAQCGAGYFRVLADWVDNTSFNQEIRLESIHNPFSVYFDPAAKSETREDATFCFVTEVMSRDDFEEAFPKAEVVDAEHDERTDNLENWHESGRVVVAEYIYRDVTEREIGLLATGEVVDSPRAPMNFVRKRTVQDERFMWAKITGKEVLEGPIELPCGHMPIIAVLGEELNVGEEVYRSSVIRHAKDPQRLYNYWSSAQTEMIALQPKAPYLVTAKQIAGFESFWQGANNSNEPFLPYNPDEKAPPPQRMTPPVPSSGMMQEVAKASDDMKSTTGIYDAGLGNRSNEKSGVAIRQRQMEGDISTSIYSDNMATAIEQAGRVIVSMIPRVYDTNRMVAVLGKDGATKLKEINGAVITQDGLMPVNDMLHGKYNVRVSVGPSYSTQRQDAAENMIDFVRAFPAAGAITADLVARNMDWPGADEFAERLQKTLPPGFIDEDPTPESMMAQQAAMQAQQAAQQMEMRKAQAEVAQGEAEAVEAQADAEKARLEVAEQSLELAAKNGQLNAAIAQIVQAEVARALQSAMVPMAPLPGQYPQI